MRISAPKAVYREAVIAGTGASAIGLSGNANRIGLLISGQANSGVQLFSLAGNAIAFGALGSGLRIGTAGGPILLYGDMVRGCITGPIVVGVGGGNNITIGEWLAPD